MSDQTIGMGHATSDQQHSLLEMIEAGDFPAEVEVGSEPMPARGFLNQMSDCLDILPRTGCDDLELSQGSTYGEAARVLIGRLPTTA